MEISVIGKVLQTLEEIAPQVTHVSLIFNPITRAQRYLPARRVDAEALEASRRPSLTFTGCLDIERVVAATAAKPGGGILFPPDITIEALVDQTVAAVAQNRLPAIYPLRSYVLSGGLISYGTDRVDLYRGAASYVDRVLRGEGRRSPINSRQNTNW